MALLDGLIGGAEGVLDFVEHPFRTLMLLVGGIILMVIVAKILLN